MLRCVLVRVLKDVATALFSLAQNSPTEMRAVSEDLNVQKTAENQNFRSSRCVQLRHASDIYVNLTSVKLRKPGGRPVKF
jgi:hypothetical protein